MIIVTRECLQRQCLRTSRDGAFSVPSTSTPGDQVLDENGGIVTHPLLLCVLLLHHAKDIRAWRSYISWRTRTQIREDKSLDIAKQVDQ